MSIRELVEEQLEEEGEEELMEYVSDGEGQDFDEIEEPVRLDKTFPDTVFVCNLPKVNAEKKVKLLSVLDKIISADKYGANTKSLPINEDTNMSEGYLIVQFENAEKADNAAKILDGFSLDKNHTFKVVKMDQFDLEMAADLEALRQNLSKVEAPLSDEVSATWNVLLGYNASYQALEQEAHEFLAGADALQDEASSSETAGMQTFTREFELSQKMASDAAAEMRSENDAIFGNTSESVDVLSVLRSRALEQVKGSIADLEKGVGHSDRELAKVLELEEYQDNATLARVAGDIKSADDSLRQLRTWRDAADQDKKAWRDKVTAKFEEMGHALDVETLEAEEEKAAQEFAVQQAMNHLTTHLSEELGTMSEAARLQIAALTAEAGAKIRELMNDTTLSDEEKARRLAEIKDKLRRDALRVLRGGVSGDLHNSAMERKLRAAKDEVMAAVAQITSYNTGAGPSRDTLDRELARVVAKVRDAGANIDAGGAFPSVFMQRVATAAVDAEVATSDQRESAAWERWLAA